MRNKFVIFTACLLTAAFIISSGRGVKLSFASPSLTVLAGGKTYVFCGDELENSIFGLRLKGIDEVLSGIAADCFLPCEDAVVTFKPNNDNKFSYKKEKIGRKIDEEQLKTDVLTALSVGGGQVEANTITLYPAFTVEKAKKESFLRGSFTTKFPLSTAERKENIKLSASSLIGKTLQPGETLSFNKAVGERTEERGYKTAKVIIDGKMTDGLGGGVCQTSSTLYNAALRAGLKIAERHPHSVAPVYVDKSFDATVSYGLQDLKIVNDTSGRIYIGGFVTNKEVTFEIFGLENEYEYLFESVTQEEIVEKDELSGENFITGYVTEGIVTVKKDGKIVKKYRLSKDKYTLSTPIARASGEND